MRWMAAAVLVGVAVVESGAPNAAMAPDARLAVARYVALGFNVGTEIVPERVSPELLREEREAAQRIREAIRAWGKYTVVDSLARADVVLAVRKGRVGSLGVESHTGGAGSRPAPAPGPVGGAQFSSPDDLLEALEPGSFQLIWRATPHNGLAGRSRRSSRRCALKSRRPRRRCASAEREPKPAPRRGGLCGAERCWRSGEPEWRAG
jgi:hypothetical protein